VKIVSVVGARPQFVKLGMMARAFGRAVETASDVEHVIVHTGQHYDRSLSDVFFDELELPSPDMNLGVGSGPHGAQTGAMLRGLEDAFIKLEPELVLAYGDTNTTLASALAAVKLHIPVGHIEAGLRSHNKQMPEEVNRIVSDHVATLLFCPTRKAVDNLCEEGFGSPLLGGRLVPIGSLRPETRATADRPWVVNVGDVMYDSVLFHRERASTRTRVLEDLGLAGSPYGVLTVHRAENTDDPTRLREIFSGAASVARSGLPVVCPLHPRTKGVLAQHVARELTDSVRIIEPASYYEMLTLLANARLVLTDSGGVQREAYMLGVDCVTLRDETEWVELLETGRNRLAGARAAEIVASAEALLHRAPPVRIDPLYGDGHAADRIVEVCLEWGRLG
jgi:UDP-GlcNAc3NAcA epimerase